MKIRKDKETGKMTIKVKKGLLHEKMGISDDKKISDKKLDKEEGKAKKDGDTKLEKEVVFAKNAKNWNHDK
jgi:hypothetical protein